ncbi:hypothetical protein GS399_04085 [Pedobacter sp. HMF7647]|uniref:Lipid/polyisoprenoid-binding YceI-like domain-containing protein n=1 Tax=Hufsiella arboris TaxID=2695275 RepID=A0A7K1Y7U9_9SPHI|nr:YceI family protein [Hufsiella arboris]MXV50138.1 hypothetical protein [Hufsiella arboris]
MIKKSVIVLVLALLQFSSYSQQVYRLDIKKSKILWNTRNAMGAHRGYLLFNSGSLNYSEKNEPVTGSFSMNMNSIRSTDHAEAADNQEVDNELRTPGFLNIDKYPAATINVTQIVRTGGDIYKVTDDLIIKGITKPIEFTSKITQKGTIIQAAAELTINRLKWNINLQPEAKSWDFYAAIKDKMIEGEIPVTLNLVLVK